MSNGRWRERDHQLVPKSGSPVQCFVTGRACAQKGCVTVLSIYNGTSLCYLHERRDGWRVNHALYRVPVGRDLAVARSPVSIEALPPPHS